MGISPRVCPISPPHATAAGLLLWARRAGDIDCCTAGGRHQHGAVLGRLKRKEPTKHFIVLTLNSSQNGLLRVTTVF